MLEFEASELAYITDGAFGASRVAYIADGAFSTKSKWLAFPLVMRVQSQTYSNATEIIRDLCREIEHLIWIERSDCQVLELLDFDRTYKGLTATLELRQLGLNKLICVASQFVILEFKTQDIFWQKVFVATRILDRLLTLHSKYRTHKQVNLSIAETPPGASERTKFFA